MFRCPACHRRLAPGSRCAQDSWQAPAEPDPLAAEGGAPELPGCTVGRRLGAGGFADVWEAFRLPSLPPVALKVGRTDQALLVARFGREAEAMLRVGPPCAPRLHGYGKLADGRPYLMMDRLDGATLATWLEACERPPEAARALAVGSAVIAAVQRVHARGIVHRDLKPENIFIDEAAASAVLVDFGLSRSAAKDGAPRLDAITRPGTAAGTLEYAAPEQLRGDPEQDERADVYSLGVVLYELFTLRPPFVGDAADVEYGHLALRPRRPGELARVPEAIERLVLDCLAKDAARRPPSVAALSQALREAASGAHVVGGVSSASSAAAGTSGTAARGAMLAEGRRPVVLLLAETAAPASVVLGTVTGRRGLLVRQRGRRYVALFSASETDAPIDAAFAAARELCAETGARTAVHLAPVTIRPRPDGPPAVYGVAVDRPETWLPAHDWSGMIHTAEIARAAPSTERALPLEAPLLGRDDGLATLAESAARALAGRPALVTLLGDHGLGKSRLAAEAAACFLKASPAATVITLRAAQPAAGDVERTSRELFVRLQAGEVPAHPVDRSRALAAALASLSRTTPLAVILDDAHWADDAALDALELATLQGPSALWVVVAVHPRFEEARRGWGARAERHDRITLGGLAEPAGRELAAALLAPAEYPPAEALAQLHAWAGGNPACLTEIVAALKEGGYVRRRAATGSHYLVTSELRQLPAAPAWQWLAARTLDAMPPELSACVRLCAVLGAGFTRGEVERVQEALDRAGSASTPIDAGVGLRALCERGVLAPLAPAAPAAPAAGERFSFRSSILEDAICAMLDGAHRSRIHQTALVLWREQIAASPGEPEAFALERLARHAAAAGARAEAATVFLTLGDRERVQHRNVAADAHYTAALGQLAGDDAAARARVLAGRGKVRYRLYRTADSLADFAAARALARQVGDLALVADLALEQATALDWENDFAGSSAHVEEARPLVEQLGDPQLALRLLVAEGRSSWRHGRVAEAVAQLGRGAALAEAAGDYDARVVALLLLSCALVVAGRLDEAEARSDEVIALATAARDSVHLCAAYGNRFFLWSVRKELPSAVVDMRRAMELAREAGNPWPERAATINLAELLFWCGRDGESLELARRSRALEERFMPRPVHESALVLARVHAARGDHAEAAALAAWIDERCPPGASAPSAHALLGAVRLLVNGGGAPEAWDALFAESSGLVPVERLELLYHRARAAAQAGRREEVARVVAEAAELFDESPDFRRRFAALETRDGGLWIDLPPN